MIRFYFHPTPNPAKVALFLEEAGLPYEVVPVDTSKGRAAHGRVPRHQPERQGAGDRRHRRAGRGRDARLRLDRDPALSRREDRQAHGIARRPAASCCHGCSSSPPGSGRSPARRCISSAPRRKSCPMRSTAIGARRSAITGAEQAPRGARVHRRQRVHDRRHIRPGAGLTGPVSCCPAATIRLPPIRISAAGSRR